MSLSRLPGNSFEVCGNIIHLNASPRFGRGMWHSEAVTTDYFPGPYHPDAIATVTEYGQHRFTWTETNWQCSASADISVSFYEQPEDVYAGYDKVLHFIFETDLGIPNAFSPNNSGFNDRFIIKGIENSSYNKLTVFNRQGNIVFEAANYQNEWDGRNHNGVPLQEDTYFFILNVDNQFSYKGFIILKR